MKTENRMLKKEKKNEKPQRTPKTEKSEIFSAKTEKPKNQAHVLKRY